MRASSHAKSRDTETRDQVTCPRVPPLRTLALRFLTRTAVKASSVAPFRVVSICHRIRKEAIAREAMKKTIVRTVGAPAEVRTKYFPDESGILTSVATRSVLFKRKVVQRYLLTNRLYRDLDCRMIG